MTERKRQDEHSGSPACSPEDDAAYNPTEEEAELDRLLVDAYCSGAKIVIVSPCGHPLSDAKCTGIPNWQNRWTCSKCGNQFSR